ncbi:ABC transporter ATP-binding protein [Pseudomonadota bacterium]|nr:ABC transporter ATP-binding protein [Pseudomonadota bacterium]
MSKFQESNYRQKILEVNGLTIKAIHPVKKNIVRNISFEIGVSETIALVGESGSGKSLTALSLFGLQPNDIQISAGKVKFDNQLIYPSTESDLRALRRYSVGFVFQEAQSSLNPVISIGQQILEVLKNSGTAGVSTSEQKQKAMDLINEVEIDDPQRVFKSYPHQLSGGMKQRVMIAIALAKNPRLLIADEPTTALDVSVQSKILELIKSIQKRTKMSILFITHDLAVAFQISDRVMVMRDGCISDKSSTGSLHFDAPSSYSKELMKALPSWTKREKEQKNVSQVLSDPIVKVNELNTSFKLKKDKIFSRRKYFKALDNVSFALRKSSTLAVVGESGSGKTTLARTILGLCSAEISGRVIFHDTDILNCGRKLLRKIRANLQVVFQDPISSLNPRMRVGEIIEEGIKIHRPSLAKNDIDKKIRGILNDVGLSPDCVSRFPHEFSGGQRQRICIARALAVEPKVIICDEPTSSLDVLIQAQIIELLKQLQINKGISYLFITHDINLVSYFADDVLVLRKGKVVEFGPVEKIIINASNPYTQALISAAPKIPKYISRIFE